MHFDWNVILWCCITIAFLIISFLIIYYILSARMLKKKRKELIHKLDEMKAGKEILFAGGIKGKIVKAGKDDLLVEVAKGVEFTISRLAVNQVLNKGKMKLDAYK